MKHYVCALMLAGVGITASMPYAVAQEASRTPKKAATKTAVKKSSVKSPSKKKAAKPKKAAEPMVKDDDDIVPDLTGSTTVDYQCEMGNQVTIYENQTDSQHVALRWNKKVHRLTRIGTTTGASRFENKKYGLVWIGIPAKGMLLDSKKGQQLANECRNAFQLQPKPQEVTKQQEVMVNASEPVTPAPAQQAEGQLTAPVAEPENLVAQ